MVYLFLADIDLSDESGNLKNLRDFPNKYAADLLEDREKLVLIRIERESALSSHPSLEPVDVTSIFY